MEGTGPYKFLIDDYNLISNIDHFQKRIQNTHQSTIKYSHIYSHLNKKSKREHILRTKGNKTLQLHLQRITARNLNEACNKGATLQHTLRNPLLIPLEPQIISMKINGLTITTKNLNFIHSATKSQQFESYLKNKFKWTTEVFHTTDWQTIQRYMQTLTLEQKYPLSNTYINGDPQIKNFTK